MAAETTATAFEQARSDFCAGLSRDGLKKKDVDMFSQVTQDSFLKALAELQNEQQAKRRGMNLARLKPIIEAMDQLGKVVEVFVNAQVFVAYVWGPMKLILQIAGAFSEAFNDLLDIYENIGESFYLLTQSEQLFRADPHMIRLLILMYKDIFEFHRHAIKYFRQPLLKQIFHATWKTYKSRFSPLIDRIHGRGDLIHRQATLSQIRQFQQARDDQEADRQLRRDEEQSRRFRLLCDWLHSPNVDNDQYRFSEIRQQYPETGRWLLDEPIFKRWFDPKSESLPALLWVNGMPGAGKTILSSLIIEAAKALPSSPTVMFFYCKGGDKEKDNFDSMGRTFLVHLLEANKDILMPYYYEYYANSKETTLRTHSAIEDLLRISILNCPSVYIILDGIDECERSERKRITGWFRLLAEDSCANNKADPVRCIFISQDDGVARKDFSGMTAFKIESKHNSTDIKTFCKASAKAIQGKFELQDHERDDIVERIHGTAKGMFLLAKLISTNLIDQPSQADLELELEDENLPEELAQAYSRIINRILVKAPRREKEASQKLLEWIVCAKRPLKWHEIQAAKSIHLKTQTVDLKRYGFRVTSKDLCGSLVEVREDGIVELVHSTAKAFLMQELVKVQLGELQLTSLCLSYLNLSAISGHESRDELFKKVTTGYFAFLDYSVGHWVRHLEAGLTDGKVENEQLFEDLAVCLQAFLKVHFRRPTSKAAFQPNQGIVQRLAPFQHLSFHSDLQVAIVSARKQLTFHGEMDGESPLNLQDIVIRIRSILEEVYKAENDHKRRAEFREMYGDRIFKCPKLSCYAFHNGFATAKERDAHVDKHKRPFRCTVEGCPQAFFGFSTEGDLDKHMKKTHTPQRDGNAMVPQDYGVKSRHDNTSHVDTDGQNPEDEAGVLASPSNQHVISEEEEIQGGDQPASALYPCPECSKVFRRKYNLQAHMVIHNSSRPYSCKQCTLSFARQGDLVRHERSHGPKNFTCGGILKSGEAWGCKKTYARADTLKAHHKTETGKKCIQPWLQEQGDDEVL